MSVSTDYAFDIPVPLLEGQTLIRTVSEAAEIVRSNMRRRSRCRGLMRSSCSNVHLRAKKSKKLASPSVRGQRKKVLHKPAQPHAHRLLEADEDTHRQLAS